VVDARCLREWGYPPRMWAAPERGRRERLVRVGGLWAGGMLSRACCSDGVHVPLRRTHRSMRL